MTTPLRDLQDGETAKVQGSGSSVYTLKNTGGVYSCTCPAWMHQSLAIERRTCKHLRAFRGDEAEKARLGTAELVGKPVRRAPSPTSGGRGGSSGTRAEGGEPPLLLAHKWETHIDLTGWWMSEKLDGVRAYWDGAKFISRQGNVFHAPAWFIEGLPRTPLDGELWGGRKKFQRTVGIVKRQDKSDVWKEIRFLVFDAPSHGGSFEERLEHCREVLSGTRKWEWADVHHHEVVRDVEHLRQELARVESLGGEGLMLRRPKSRYEVGRSTTLLKVKSFHDAEARVVGHVPGEGRHRGRLGSLLAEMPDGTRFNVGSGFSDAEREAPPPVGAVITYRFQELSEGGVPRFPTYVGVRIDMDWAMVLAQSKTQRPVHVHPAPVAAASPAVAPPAPPVVPLSSSSPQRPGDAMKKRYFEFSEGTSNKFWEVWIEGNEVRTRYGKIGSNGQVTIKDEGTPEKAQKLHDKLVREKTGKGYQERTAGGGPSAPAAPAPAAPAPMDHRAAWKALASSSDLPAALEAHLAFLCDTPACRKVLSSLCAAATSVEAKEDELTVVFTSPEGTEFEGEEWTLTASPPYTGSFDAVVPKSHRRFCEHHNGMALEGLDVPLSFNGVTGDGHLGSGCFEDEWLEESEPELYERFQERDLPVLDVITHHQDFVLYNFLKKSKLGEPVLQYMSHEGGGLDAPYDTSLGITGVFLRLLASDVLGDRDLEKKEGDSGEDDGDEGEGGAAGGSRRFEFSEGSSSKFWEISVEGSSHTVRYGKIGTDGQTKTKDFGDEDEAQADAERLIAEKTKKGYVEVDGED